MFFIPNVLFLTSMSIKMRLAPGNCLDPLGELRALSQTSQHWTKAVVTCKMKHFQNICKNVFEPSTIRGSAVDVKCCKKCYILHVTNAYLQHVFNLLKHLQKCLRAINFPWLCHGSKNVINMFYFTRNHIYFTCNNVNLQHVFNMLRYNICIFSTLVQMF